MHRSVFVPTVAVKCSPTAYRLGGVKMGSGMTGKLGCAWVAHGCRCMVAWVVVAGWRVCWVSVAAWGVAWIWCGSVKYTWLGGSRAGTQTWGLPACSHLLCHLSYRASVITSINLNNFTVPQFYNLERFRIA